MLNPALLATVKVWMHNLIALSKEHLSEGALAMDPQTMDLSKTTVKTNTANYP